MREIRIADHVLGEHHPTYFIADISANHDGDLGRARDLIYLCAEAGAHAAKFQNFRAEHIVSDQGFRSLGGQLSHQSSWKRSVFEVYKAASLPWEWTPILAETCRKAGVDYFSSPYDLEAVDMLDPHVPAHKIGSGEITWPEILRHVASKGKPVLLATGASHLGEVQRAVEIVREINPDLVLMQCNTNYTGRPENFDHIHLNVLRTFAVLFPEVVLGLSDHTPGHATVLGAVALGARAIEKHFTDDPGREGPDHPFSMDPRTWKEMVDRTRELERSLGSTEKKVAGNEAETVILQRRCVRAARELPSGSLLTRGDLEVLRPAPHGSISPARLDDVVGMRTARALPAGEALRWIDLVAP